MTGSLIVNQPLDREIVSSYILTVRALDRGTPQLRYLQHVNAITASNDIMEQVFL